MTPEGKWKAILDLAPPTLLYRKASRTWYVGHRGVEVLEGSILRSPTQMSTTPVAAIEEYWDELAPAARVVVNAGLGNRRDVTWNPLTKTWQPADSPIELTNPFEDTHRWLKRNRDSLPRWAKRSGPISTNPGPGSPTTRVGARATLST